MPEMRRSEASDESVTGVYDHASHSDTYNQVAPGLFGRYDNVYRNWEDPLFRGTLSRFLQGIRKNHPEFLSGTPVLDLGCGSGKGWDLLHDLREPHVAPDRGPLLLENPSYLGVDLSPGMIRMAQRQYGSRTDAMFREWDLTQGLPPEVASANFRIFFSSYGTLSHLDESDLEALIEEILERTGERSVFVADLLGRFSYEWPCYWSEDGSRKPYSMSHIVPPALRKGPSVDSFPMRFWGGEEFREFVGKAASARKIRIVNRLLRDRSLLVGRHLDTREYNPSAPPLRWNVNSLFERNRRTPLENLRFSYQERKGFAEENRFFHHLTGAWNALVESAERLFEGKMPPALPEAPWKREVERLVQELKKGVEAAPHLPHPHPRENLLEPALAYQLRALEERLQKGKGNGHSLLALFEFEKE